METTVHLAEAETKVTADHKERTEDPAAPAAQAEMVILAPPDSVARRANPAWDNPEPRDSLGLRAILAHRAGTEDLATMDALEYQGNEEMMEVQDYLARTGGQESQVPREIPACPEEVACQEHLAKTAIPAFRARREIPARPEFPVEVVTRVIRDSPELPDFPAHRAKTDTQVEKVTRDLGVRLGQQAALDYLE